MLRLVDRRSRREFLRVGSLALGSLTLPGLWQARALAGSQNLVTDKSVVFLFLHGGPSQIETFDPKMSAPAEIRSVTGEIATSLPGVTFGGTLPKLAARAHKFSVVRSFTTGDANHDIKPVVSKDTAGANLGSLYARVAGTNHPRSGMPRNVALFPRAVDAATQPGTMNFGRFGATGVLGSAYAPFMPDGDGNFQRDLELGVSTDRLSDRRSLLVGLDRMKRDFDRTGWQALGQMQQQAFETISGGIASAFNLEREDPRVVERYDTKGLMRPESISTAWNNHKNYKDHVATLGKLMLLARRMCEAGCGFVTVTTNFVWDMHADSNNATITEGMRYCGNPLDHAVSAFIDDVEARGLRDKILLVVCGEMGRSPKLNSKGGRDHWGGLAPLLLYGGGLEMGRVIGQSTRDAGAPATEPVTNANLVATVLGTLIDRGQLRVERGVPSDVLRAATAAEPIAGLA